MNNNVVLGTFTNTKEYLPALLESINRFVPQYPFQLVFGDDTIAGNMEKLRQQFIKTGKRYFVFLDHDIQFLSKHTVEAAIATAVENDWAITGVHADYDPECLNEPYNTTGLWSSEVKWLPGLFMLVDSSKIGDFKPDQDLPGNCCSDVAYTSAVRSAGFKIGIAAEKVYHIHKPWRDLPGKGYWETRNYLQKKYGYFCDCHTEKEKPMYRFHVPGLAYLATHPQYSPCAFTSKLLGLCKMLMMLGHEVYFYGAENSEVDCTEFIQCISEEDHIRIYGEYDWHKDLFKVGDYQTGEAFEIFNANAAREINARKQRGDFLLCQVGYFQKPIADEAGANLIIAEPGIGHAGMFAPYRVFESYTWAAYLYGKYGIDDGPWYDAVIPGYYDPNQFPVCYKKDDYFLFLGRVVKRKGIELAIQIAQKMGKRLIIAGQGELNSASEQLHLDPLPKGVEWVGAAGPELRAELMGHALATLMPVHYIEPFGAVAVESQLVGTPIITTDWGAFSETVLHGVTGYRCRTWDHFIFAANQCVNGKIDYYDCREWAEKNFSIHRAKHLYQEYFTNLYNLWTNSKGWYTENPERQSLDWLTKHFINSTKDGWE